MKPGSDAMRAEHLRAMNMRLVLSHVLMTGEYAAPSRAQVATQTNLTRATATSLVDELVASGLLQEMPRPRANGPGRPALGLTGSPNIVGLGAEIGVDGLRVVATNLAGHELVGHSQAHNLVGSSPQQALTPLARLLTEVIQALPTTARLVRLTVAVPGLVDTTQGRLLEAPNLGWHDVDLAAALAQRLPLPLPVTVDNEANLAALTVAQRAPGAPSPNQSFAFLSGSIGIGAALVADGQVMRGRHGWAGEIGHLTIDPAGPDCRCGSTGCLERYVGAEALVPLLTHPSPIVPPPTAGRPLDPRSVSDCAQALGIAVAALVNLFDIPQVVLGGHLAELLSAHEPLIRATLERRSMGARRRRVTLAPSRLGPTTVAVGASYAALADLIAHPHRYLGDQPPRTAENNG
ncbi:ROK family protein [Buchananella hordeovulneris]|uniref:ROK family protein n=1 Tax=Buchananella hordeovulneris TaxID=52770 RepID=UPI0026DBC61C|nr:ROK family protein [Buchananella hordeovulneris]MDO5080426.1 ROK family protein [Buchananella hordeovulneris]